MFYDLNNRKEFLDFLERTPEISVSIDKKNGGYIVNFPEGAQYTNYTYFMGNLTLSCIYNGEKICFPEDIKIYKKKKGKKA